MHVFIYGRHSASDNEADKMADPMCGAVYLPGDILGNLKTSESTGKSLIGPGLQRKGDQIVVAKPGILKHREPNFYWIDTHQKRVSDN